MMYSHFSVDLGFATLATGVEVLHRLGNVMIFVGTFTTEVTTLHKTLCSTQR